MPKRASSRTSASLLGFVREMNLTAKIAMVVGSDEVVHHKPLPEPVNVRWKGKFILDFKWQKQPFS